ncbi:hypothetical protein [Fangia hongkongensis]|uniref:hypothetical protein n=1 Tax=Fangia hongkongensis TaxID=270495 RepID=UPI00037E4715|nr:hypothetical protein [Fangia hongkongensis]MBK2125324.1 hypothetical protein [Fangia hongkongensis]
MEFTNSVGLAYSKLPIPKTYCYANKGQQLQSLPFLAQHQLQKIAIDAASHWVLQENTKAALNALNQFILQNTNTAK